MPTGMLLAPIGNPEPRGYSPLDTLLFLAAMVSTLSKLGGFHAVKNEKSEKHFHHGVVVLRFSRMGYCLVFANSHVSAMAKAEERTIFVCLSAFLWFFYTGKDTADSSITLNRFIIESMDLAIVESCSQVAAVSWASALFSCTTPEI